MARPPRIANWLPWEQSTIYFITMCVEGRERVLANPLAWKVCLQVFALLDRWTILAAIAMPDHLHLLVRPDDRDASVSDFSRWFKRWFQRELRRLCPLSEDQPPWRWQQGCFDRLLRSDESSSEKWAYLRENPVRAGLVCDSGDWPYQIAFNSQDGKL